MNTLSERLNHALELSGLSPSGLAARAKVTKGTISQWASNVSNVEHIKAASLDRIAGALGVRSRWLLYGEKPMTPDDDDRWATVDRVAISYAAGEGDDNEYVEAQLPLKFLRESLIRHGLNEAQLGTYYTRGDSMHPMIQDGDVLLVDLSDKALHDGEIYCVALGGHRMVKRVFRQGDGRYIFRGDNSADPRNIERRYPDDDLNLEVVGAVVWHGGWLTNRTRPRWSAKVST